MRAQLHSYKFTHGCSFQVTLKAQRHGNLTRANCQGMYRENVTEEYWDQYWFAQKKLSLLILEENYAAGKVIFVSLAKTQAPNSRLIPNGYAAAAIRDHISEIVEQLPSSKQMLIALLDQLHSAKSAQDKIAIVQSLGALGDPGALPVIQQCLADERLGDIAESAMWELFLHPPDSRADSLLAAGMQHMAQPDEWRSAVRIFTELIAIAPQFAEGYNKRATTFYLMNDYERAIADCRRTLEKNEYHFGAASGMGMCFAAIGDYKGAIEAFSTAMNINPRLSHLKYHIEQLKDML